MKMFLIFLSVHCALNGINKKKYELHYHNYRKTVMKKVPGFPLFPITFKL